MNVMFSPHNFMFMDKAIQQSIENNQLGMAVVYEDIDKDLTEDLVESIDPILYSMVFTTEWYIERAKYLTELTTSAESSGTSEQVKA